MISKALQKYLDRSLPAKLLKSIKLQSGSHSTREEGLCAMEAVAWLAGKKHSDSPSCACPVIAAFLRSWNDALPAEERTKLLRPLLPKIVGTKSTAAIEEQRSFLALDWLIRAHTPEWLDLRAELKAHAASLRGLSPIVDMRTAQAARKTVDAARVAARVAAWDAAGDAAWGAAWAAAGDAARDAAWAALAPTRERLQISAVELVERMIALGGEQ